MGQGNGLKYVILVLDGLADAGQKTPLETAEKPNMAALKKRGICGLIGMDYRKDAVNSDVGCLLLLGSYSDDEYPGRGYLEALGAGLEPGENDLCIRGNFATLDANGNVSDRRAGRDETGLEDFTRLLDGMEIDGVHFTVKKSSGHRVVIIASGSRISDTVTPNDPMIEGEPLLQIKPIDPLGEKSKFTASVLNKFTYRARRILSEQQKNKERAVPANVILIRNVGRKRGARSFQKRFGLMACCISGIAVVRGVSRFLGMDFIEVDGATGMPNTNLKGKFDAAIKALGRYDLVFLHVNGTDILSHDARRDEKRIFIDKIDKEFGRLIKSVDMKKTVFIVTCDHGTVSSRDFRGYRHMADPVPVLISGDGIKPDRITGFSEASCREGMRIEKNGLLKTTFKLTGSKQ